MRFDSFFFLIYERNLIKMNKEDIERVLDLLKDDETIKSILEEISGRVNQKHYYLFFNHSNILDWYVKTSPSLRARFLDVLTKRANEK